MIITIDGPAGAGKSTIAKELARRLGYEYLDTGSMYRAVALLGQRNHAHWEHPEELLALARGASIDVRQGKTLLNGEDVTSAVRSPEITQLTRFAADHPGVREIMVREQRRLAEQITTSGAGLVTEGRDQGTVVFPKAECKIFLTATPEARTRRRLGEMQARGEFGNFQEILHQINLRDERDSNRKVGPLRQPPDAELLITDGMDIPAVLDCLLAIVRRISPTVKT